MAEINWGLLVHQNRAKAIGVSWSDAEMKAIYELGIPADDVRRGVLTLEEFESEKAQPEGNNEKFIRSMSKDELKNLATELGIVFPSDAKRLEIISLIKKSKLPADSE